VPIFIDHGAPFINDLGIIGTPVTSCDDGKESEARFLQAYLSLKLPILALLHVRGSLTMSLPG
jgi:hypothetical protein